MSLRKVPLCCPTLLQSQHWVHCCAQLASISKHGRNILLGSKRKRLDACSEGKSRVEEDYQQALATATSELICSFKQTGSSFAQATRKLRQVVSTGKTEIPTNP